MVSSRNVSSRNALQTQYIVAAFVCGTALVAGTAYGTWLYTKSTMDVQNVRTLINPETKKFF